VIDTTPNIDAYLQGPGATDLNANTAFPDQSPIVRWRLFTGLRLLFGPLAVTAELGYALCNDRGLRCGVGDPAAITDRSLGQAQLTLSAAAVF
jgi:hypothetical protein